jgi:hypothetical protein
MNKILHLTFLQSCLAALIATAVILMSFIILEPTVGRAVGDQFIVTQTITSEISFVASTSDVVMDSSITSITGGSSNGTTTAVISTNDNDGYNMTIYFSSTTAMSRNSGGGVIANYAPASGGVPDFAFSNEIFGQFAYRVTGAQATDVDPTFRDNGTTDCATGSSNTYGACWFNPEPVGGAETIINRTSATPAGGSTTTINFRVHVPPNPNPTIPDGVYTATATLTALTN